MGSTTNIIVADGTTNLVVRTVTQNIFISYPTLVMIGVSCLGVIGLMVFLIRRKA